jgi:hypothetical protein
VASSITDAASQLASAAYPFMKGVDWTDDLYGKPIPGKSAQDVLGAIDKMIVLGSKMDGPALQEAAMAHAKAINNIDAKGVLTQEDFKSILAGLGKMLASVPRYEVMGVYDEMSKIAGLSSGIPAFMYAKQNPTDAVAAYDALIAFSDVVKKAQPSGPGPVGPPSMGNAITAGVVALLALLSSPAFH